MKMYFILLTVLTLLACKDKSDSINNNIDTAIEKAVEKTPTPVKDMPSLSDIKAELEANGFETFDYVDEKTLDTILMQKYFMVFLKRGSIVNQNEEELERLQELHIEHLSKMYKLGYADISGPFGDDWDTRGITIYNVPNLETADSLAKLDPMVKAGHLKVEVHPWWAAKGYSLR